MKPLYLAAFFFLATFSAFSQSGKIRGKVTSLEDGEPLVSAAIFVLEQDKKTSTDLDGNFTLTLDPGAYTVVCRYVACHPDTVKLTVKTGEVTVYNFALPDKSIKMDDLVITIKEERGSIDAIDRIKKKSATLMDGVSSEQFARTGDNDAATAAAKVTGVTVEGGRYVYVRGLSDRYSKTTLNSAEIPGLDPNRNTVQMDLFPTNLIENMTVIKSFSPEYPGSFTGGLVNIETKDFPEKFTFQFSSTLGYNTLATFNRNFLTSEGGKHDRLGFDDGSRAIPSVVLGAGVLPAPFTSPESDNKLTTYSRAFNKNWQPTTQSAGLNQQYSVSFGNQYTSKKNDQRSFGLIAGLTYATENEYYGNGHTGRYMLGGNTTLVNELSPQKEFKDRKGTESVLWGALLNGSLKFNANHKISLMLMRNQNGMSSARMQEGIIPLDNPDLIFQTRTVQYLQRSINSAQLKGDHLFGEEGGFRMNWMGSYTRSAQEEPDLRFFSNDYSINPQGDTLYNIQPALYPNPSRFFRSMEETNIDTKLNFEKTFRSAGKEAKLRFGVSNVYKKRNFSEKRYDFRNFQTGYNGSIDDYMSDAGMDASDLNGFVYVIDASERRNSYIGTDRVMGAYAMVDFYTGPRLRVITGLRVEKTDILTFSLKNDMNDKDTGLLDNFDILPALNATYALTEKTNLRLAYSRTLARPTFRELAPFASFSFVGDYIEIGNGQLQRTQVDNLDLRIETYPRPGETYALSFFGKLFHDPIERTFNPSAANAELTYRNVSRAELLGAEIEVRKKLDFIKALRFFELGANFSYVYSKVRISEGEMIAIRAMDPERKNTREMFGQSPYIANAYLNFANDSTGWAANLNFNVSGKRLSVVMTGGTPNVYEMPRAQLDFSLQKKFARHWVVRFRARNLLNAPFRQVQEYKGTEYVFQSYDLGRTFSLGVRYEF